MLYKTLVAAAVLAVANGLSLQSGSSLQSLPRVRVVRMVADEDPIGNPFIKAINTLQESIQNSPAAKFKAGLAKLQAGDYDVAATKAELDGLIEKNGVVMFSFTT